MVGTSTGPFTLVRRVVGNAEFVAAWAKLYDYKLEHQYDDNIGKPLTPDRVRALFELEEWWALFAAQRSFGTPQLH